MIINKKGGIKRSIRNLLKGPTGNGRPAVTLERINQCQFEIDFGSGSGVQYGFDEYDDEGDPCTDADHDEIYEAVKAIVDEHNQNLA